MPAGQPGGAGGYEAEEQAHGGGQSHGYGRPFQTLGLLPDGHAGGGAGPVEQGEQHEAQGGHLGPAVGYQQLAQGGQLARLHQHPAGAVGHQGDGQDDLIGGETQNKRHQNHSVQAEQGGEGIEKAGAVGQKADSVGLNVGQQPDQHSGGSGHGDGPAQHK